MAQRPDNFKGVDLTSPVNRIPAGRVAIAQNVRAYTEGGFALRTGLSSPIIMVDSSISSVVRMNDTTPTGPEDGYCYVIVTDSGSVFVYPEGDPNPVAVGLTGDPVSQIPFRPNASVKPWDYIADSSMGVVLNTKYALNDSSATFACFGNIKVRSDGLVYKTGIREPALAPTVSTGDSSVIDSGPLLATAIPWTNYAGQNPNYDYGESAGPPNPGSPCPVDGTPPFIVDVANASTIKIIALSGVADINGNPSATPATLGPSTALTTNPGHYIQIAGTGARPATATVVVGAFTDGSGNVIPAGVSPLWVPSVVDVGAAFAGATTIQVPSGAKAFQIGINSTAAAPVGSCEPPSYNDNSGQFEIAVEVTTDALPPYTGILGSMSLFYWGDSPTSGGVASYLWKNPGDPGGGIPRSTSNAVGSTTGNSFIFDATFTAGIPGLPGTGTEDVPMQWFALSPESAVIGSAPVFPSPITATYPTNKSYNNFNFCLYGQIYIPAPGQYTFVVTSHDDFIWGIQDAVLISAVASGSGEGGTIGLSNAGQTITVAQGYPLLPRQNYTDGEGGNYSQTTVVLAFAAAGVYGIEADYDYWFHSGRIFLIEASPTPGASPTIIPPLTAAVRTGVSYAGKYRSSLTGAQSNPSPTTTPTTTPVLASTVALPYSPDPQVDKCDYYRQDQGLANFTYVGTGPNTNPPTGIVDALTDLEVANNQQMTYTDYEPVPSIDLPQAGHCNVSGGVITTLDTPFNERWLPGTIILIGYPTQLPYEFISRPISPTEVVIPGVPDGSDLVWNIAEPALANQPLAYMAGPTDNINYVLMVGDKLRPGTIYWCAGSNLDAWPVTNQADLTDPSEALVNVAMAAGYAVVFTIKRGFVYTPNFFNALATVTGTSGSTWTQQATAISRGLFIPRCLAVEGGGNIFFRVDDGIHWSRRGAASASITDEDLYPLFVHEGSTPEPVVRNGKTYYPPDDSQPERQQFSIQNGYLYYDYAYAFGGEIVVDRTFILDSGATAGVGIPWENPGEAIASGAQTTAGITSWSVSGNVFTFIAENDFTANEFVVFGDLENATWFNGLTLKVLASGLSGTQFQVDFPWPDTGATSDSGTAAAAMNNFASLAVPAPPFAPGAGESVAWSTATVASSPDVAQSNFVGAMASAAAATWASGGSLASSSGGPFLGTVISQWSGFQIPSLPVGAVITRIYPVFYASGFVGNADVFLGFGASIASGEVWSDFFPTGAFNQQATAPAEGDSLGNSESIITQASVFVSLKSAGYFPGVETCQFEASGVALAVYYTVPGGGPPSNQTQILELSGGGLALPPLTVITGVEVNFETGLAFGSAVVETAQLTVGGTPVGTPKPLTPGAWPSPASLGGNGDLWGQESMLGAQANELSVNFGANLNAGSQLNLNDVSITVFYETKANEEGAATLVYDIRAKGFIFDQYDGAKPTVHAANEGESQQGTLVGCVDGTLRLMESDSPEVVTGIVLSPAMGEAGWATAYEGTFEYSADSGAVVSFVAADAGNGSYASNPITLPGTGGEITKFTTKLTPNKWKLLQVQFESTDQTLQVYLEGCVLQVKPWGSDGLYEPISIFRPSGGRGAQG